MSDHHDEQRLDDLLALAALGELTEAEERELDAALAADVAAEADLRADLEVAARVQAVNPIAPPDSLKAAVMQAIEGVPQSSVAPTFAPPTTPPLVPPTPEPTTPDATPEVVSLDAARERRRSRWIPLAAAAAVAFLFVGGIVATRSGDGANDVVATVINADDAQVRTFDGDLPGSLRAVFSAEADALVVDGDGVAVLADDETYQVWLVGDAGVQSVGVFRPDSDGRVAVGFVGTNPDGFVLGITVEPAGGSDEPTLPIVATA